MGVIKNDVGRPSNKTIMTRNILKGIGLIILIGIAFGVGYNLKGDKSIILQKDNKKIAIGEDVAKNAIDRVFGKDYMYNLDLYDFDEQMIKMVLATKNTKKSTKSHNYEDEFDVIINKKEKIFNYNGEDFALGDGGIIYYDYEDLNKVYKNLFLDAENAPKETMSSYTDTYVYSSKSNAYAKLGHLWGDGGNYVISSIIDSYTIGKDLYIKQAWGVAEYVGAGYSLKLTDDTEIILTEEELNDDDSCKKYKDKLQKIEFKFTKEDNLYKFVELKVTK